MTVKELKKLLKGVKDDLPVYATAYPKSIHYPEFQVDDARHARASNISNEHFSITLGDPFEW